MDSTTILAMTVAAIVSVLILSHLATKIFSLYRDSTSWLTRHLVLPKVIPATRWWPSVSRAAILAQLVVISGVMLFTFYPKAELQTAADRAGQAAIVLMGLFYLGPHLSLAADILNVSLATIKAIHYGTTFPFLILVIIHIAIKKPTSNMLAKVGSPDFYAAAAAIVLATLFVSSLRPLRRISYEWYLRFHQVLAGCLWFSVWMHVKQSDNVVVRYYVIGIAACFATGCVAQMIQIVWTHAGLYRGVPRAQVISLGNAIHITIDHPVNIKVRAGQYLNIYMPTVSWRSCLQSHPFFVTFVESHDGGMRLELMIEPRLGWTWKLLQRAKGQNAQEQKYVTFFSGPHGRTVDVDEYGLVIMVASGWGFMAQLPYVQHLIRGFNHSTTKARRVRIEWQLDDIDEGSHALDIFNQLHAGDEVDNGYIIDITVYHSTELPDPSETRVGQRARFLVGKIDPKHLIESELSRQYTFRKTQELENFEKPSSSEKPPESDKPKVPKLERSAFLAESRRALVMVSASYDLRCSVQDACRGQASHDLRLIELDYQPDA